MIYKIVLQIVLFLIITTVTARELYGFDGILSALQNAISESSFNAKVPTSDTTLNKIRSLLSASKITDDLSGAAEKYSLKGLNLYKSKKFEEALNYFRYSSILNEGRNTEAYREDCRNLAKTFNHLNRRDSSVFFFRKAANLSRELNDRAGIGKAFNNIGLMFWINSQYDSSVVYFEKALKIREKLKNKENLASTLNNLGTVYYQWAIYDKAIEYYVKALDINKELNNNTGISLVKTNIGLVFQANKNPEKAIESYRESLVFAKASGKMEPEAYVYNSLGQAFLKFNPDSSVYYFKKAYKLYVDADYLGGIMLSLQSLGQAYSIIKNWQKAEEYFRRSLKIAKERKVEMRIAESYKFLGIIEKNKKNFEPAKRYLLKSIKISEKSDLKELLRDCYKELSELNAESGNFEEAYSDLRRYLEFTTLIETEGVKRKLDELKNRFEYQHFEKRLLDEKYTNQKQQIILIASLVTLIIFGVMLSILLKYNRRIKNDYKLLSEKNEFIRKQKEELIGKNEKLDEINRGKDKLFSIIAHDLRNPFFGLINYSSMLKEEYAELSEEEKLEYISNLNKISQNTYNLLENLLHLSASRTGKIEFNPENVTLRDVVMKSINLFSSQLEEKNIKLTYSFEDELQAYCDENTVEIIIRNLLNNAIKYTNPGGHIDIKCEETADNVCIFIKDDGIGMDKETKSEIFSLSGVQSQKGTDGEKGTGLGLSLCYEFVKKNNGTISFVSEPGKGSTFEVRLPKKVES